MAALNSAVVTVIFVLTLGTARFAECCSARRISPCIVETLPRIVQQNKSLDQENKSFDLDNKPLAHDNKSLHRKHFNVANNFQCVPRPRAFLASELFHVPSDEFWSPRMTVLHRCDKNSGCCLSEGDICGAEQLSEETELIFAVGKIDRRGQIELRTVHAINVTHCQCGVPEPPR